MAHGNGAFIQDNPGKVLDFYDMDKKKIGEGSYGSVVKAKHKATSAVRAIKSISKAQMKNIDRFRQEISIMKQMDHPNIIRLYESFEDNRFIYLVLELCVGGELFDRIIDSGHFTETQAALLMQQIIRAVYYMHHEHVCHRDLKPENFLFVTKEPIEKNNLKVIDFGLSCNFTDNNPNLTTKAGTPYYVAPQVLAGKYDQQSDMWSCGVIMYVMLCGYPPFFGETDAEVLSKVRLGNFSFNAADWKNVSEDAKNLIRMLLKMNPKDRYTAKLALTHEWIVNKAPMSQNVNLQDKGLLTNLRTFRVQNKLKKAALHVIAGQLSDDKIKKLRDIFNSLDKDGDGKLTAAELRSGLEKSGLDPIPDDLQQIMMAADADGSGQVDYTEFLAASLDKKEFVQEDICWCAFRIFDKNGDGKISKAELRVVLGEGDGGSGKEVAGAFGKDTAEFSAILESVDKDGDGEIDFNEFMAMMKGTNNEPAAGSGNEALTN